MHLSEIDPTCSTNSTMMELTLELETVALYMIELTCWAKDDKCNVPTIQLNTCPTHVLQEDNCHGELLEILSFPESRLTIE